MPPARAARGPPAAARAAGEGGGVGRRAEMAPKTARLGPDPRASAAGRAGTRGTSQAEAEDVSLISDWGSDIVGFYRTATGGGSQEKGVKR